ncbi:Fic/DOC family N-terminal domain-containing protein, partial [Phenylobacterium sp.]|uniref:Fic/DOC family N-terminal domain-containing protein n=1 Tax=Phenylobacterium sp. TaxID=1871053 RepID=UPI002F3EF37C
MHRALAELKGAVGLAPNEAILLNTLSLPEAKYSSAIENIITTLDDLYRSVDAANRFASVAAKEVYAYARAIREGLQTVRATGNIRARECQSGRERAIAHG